MWVVSLLRQRETSSLGLTWRVFRLLSQRSIRGKPFAAPGGIVVQPRTGPLFHDRKLHGTEDADIFELGIDVRLAERFPDFRTRKGAEVVSTMTWIRLRSALRLGGLTPWQVIARTWKQMSDNEVMTRAAAIAFYAMLASVPFLALLLTLAVQFLPDVTPASDRVGHAAMNEFQVTLNRLFPADAALVVTNQIDEIKKNPPLGLLSIGILVTLWTASSLFLAIIDGINAMYGVHETRSLMRVRLTAIVMTLIQAAILLSSLLAIVAGPEILRWLGMDGTTGYYLILATQWIVVVFMMLASFALTFYVAPDADQKWEWVTPGSLVGTVSIILFSLLFRVYVKNWGNYEKMYGSLGGVMVLLLWLWVSGLVLLAAAQMNQIIEQASPIGKSKGQKEDPLEPPDLEKIEPVPVE